MTGGVVSGARPLGNGRDFAPFENKNPSSPQSPVTVALYIRAAVVSVPFPLQKKFPGAQPARRRMNPVAMTRWARTRMAYPFVGDAWNSPRIYDPTAEQTAAA